MENCSKNEDFGLEIGIILEIIPIFAHDACERTHKT